MEDFVGRDFFLMMSRTIEFLTASQSYAMHFSYSVEGYFHHFMQYYQSGTFGSKDCELGFGFVVGS